MTPLAKAKIAAYLAVIFMAGGVSGGVLMWRKTQVKSPPPSMEKVCVTMNRSLKEKLGLTSEQMLKIQPILDRTSREIKKIHASAIQEIDTAIFCSHELMAEYLSPEQIEKLDKIDAERREWVAKCQRNREASGK